MTGFESISITTDTRGVATLELAREDKHNALSAVMMEELTKAAALLGDDPEVRVVVITGRGASFCAGGDLKWMREQMADGPEARRAAAYKLSNMLRAINTMPKPVIARVQGNAFGGGVGIISVCDVAVCAEGAKFGLTETRLGLIPATIGPYVVGKLGAPMARRVFMSSRIFDAAEAERLGLVARVGASAELDSLVEAEVAPYLACAPGAVAAAKRHLLALAPAIDEGVIAMAAEVLVKRWEDGEAAEGIDAFFEKRKPSWVKG